MKHNIIYGVVLCLLSLFFSCSTDIIDLNGDIQGKVTDNVNGSLIANCQVSLTPGGKSIVTTTEGTFSFTDLEAGNYTLSFKKAGYEDFSKSVGVVVGQTTNVDIVLKQKAPFAVSENTLDFGDLNSTMTLFLYNNSDAPTSFKATGLPEWLNLSQTSGIVEEQGNIAIVVRVNRDMLDYGDFSSTFSFSYSGKSSGNILVNVKLKKVKLSAPTVNIGYTATEVTQNSFKIKGDIVATGGSPITHYGFCWSTTHNPTVANDKTDNGNTVETLEYTSTISGLATATIYYVRAYATNDLGTSYSNELTVTTQDVVSNKWDGNIAKSFARGNGTAVSPYEIETGGQLLLMDGKEGYFVLKNNIDLNSHNWKPVGFSGTFDGNGYTISNLKISRSTNCVGLFSECTKGATIKNFTIKGVDINCLESSSVGAVIGSLQYSGAAITNVNVVLTEQSQVIGGSKVGGIAGSVDMYNTIPQPITKCTVKSTNGNAKIGGASGVGGICGYLRSGSGGSTLQIENSEVSANIVGDQFVGGIAGWTYSDILISNCGFEGGVSTGGNQKGGGITGDDNNNQKIIYGCRVKGNIDGYALGFSKLASYRGIGAACYFSGKASTNDLVYCHASYACLTNSDGTITAVATDDNCNTSKNGEDITTFLKESYSKYADYWNFNKTWTFEGKIGGKTVKVSCPKLAWEK